MLRLFQASGLVSFLSDMEMCCVPLYSVKSKPNSLNCSYPLFLINDVQLFEYLAHFLVFLFI